MLEIRQIQKILKKWKFILLLVHLFFCFVTPCYALDVTLKWDSNIESDIDGYRVYYKSGYSGYPYNGTEATEGDSPITITLKDLGNPEQPEYTIHDLDDIETYYFVVTAYDIDGHESGYSNEVCLNCSDYISGSGGGGGDDGWVTIQGTVTFNRTPLCPTVLANGQYMFSCGEGEDNGKYELVVPLDGNGKITLFVFVDGLAPFKQVLTPEAAANFDITMELASPDSKTPTVTSTVVENIDNPGWVEIAGSVSLEGTPLCAMVLANGQYMFFCDPYGEYQLSVPLDPNGEITLFTFVDGLQPYKEIIRP